jgi:hypothetical protein
VPNFVAVSYVLMHVRIVAILALCCALSAAAAAAPPVPSERLVQGPVLAGGRVVWDELVGGQESLRLGALGSETRIVYRSSGDDRVGQWLAASASRLAFERVGPTCPPQPGFVCPQAWDTLAGRLTGPFRALAPRERCFSSWTSSPLAADGHTLAQKRLSCGTPGEVRVVVYDLRTGDRRTIASLPGQRGCCAGVAIAGRYVAWAQGWDSSLVVFDLRADRIAYHVRVGEPLGPDRIAGLDVEADGKSVVTTTKGRVLWAGLDGRAHRFRLHASGPLVRMARGRIVVGRKEAGGGTALVLADLAGRTSTIARPAAPSHLRGDFDFDGRRVTWASDRISESHVDCPPRGIMRPCIVRESGLTTIWLASAGGRPQPVARLPFADEPR